MSFIAEPIEAGMFADANERPCKVTVTSPSGFLEVSRDGETRLLLTTEGARDLADHLMRGIELAANARRGEVP